MARKSNLTTSKTEKNDEFYTQITDIEKEINHYKDQLKDKIIFCNCDDPEWSNFWKYFYMNFEHLELKKLISTHYESDKTSYKLECYKNEEGILTVNKLPLEMNGDFRSPESIELLKECDIVITNPPFSLFREYVSQLITYEKKFLIIGNYNAVTYKETFTLIKDNKMWLGVSPRSMTFVKPDKSTADVNATWFTNLPNKKRNEELILYKNYTPEYYPFYDNYSAINVNKVNEIPCDYSEEIGVPITFLDKYNPNQFEIIGLGNSRDNFLPCKDYINPKKVMKDGILKNGNAINCVLAIEVETMPSETYYISQNSKYLIAPYARIIIKNKTI